MERCDGMGVEGVRQGIGASRREEGGIAEGDAVQRDTEYNVQKICHLPANEWRERA